MTIADVLWWSVALVGAPAISGMSFWVLVRYVAERGRWPHVATMAVSYLLLLLSAVLATSDAVVAWVPIALLAVAVLLGIKGLFLIGLRREGLEAGLAPSPHVIWWAMRVLIKRKS